MTKTVKYSLIAFSIVVIVGTISQSPEAILASLVGAYWMKLRSQYWHSAYKRPPGGGKGIAQTTSRMPNNVSFA